jgi:hypothetical protein
LPDDVFSARECLDHPYWPSHDAARQPRRGGRRPRYPFTDTNHFEDPAYPRMYFAEHEYAEDPTNWWIPNRACAEAMLRSAGFQITAHPEEEVFICRAVSNDEAREFSPWVSARLESLADSRMAGPARRDSRGDIAAAVVQPL